MEHNPTRRRTLLRPLTWIVVALVLMVAATSVQAGTATDKQKMKAQKSIDRCAKSYERWFGTGSIEARFYVDQLVDNYEKYYGFRLSNPLGSLSGSQQQAAAKSIYQTQIDNAIRTYKRKYGDGYLTKKKMQELTDQYNATIGEQYGVTFDNPAGSPTATDKALFDLEQRPLLEKQYQARLDTLKARADARWGEGSDMAKNYVENYKAYYEREYSIVLKNPYVGLTIEELTEQYQQQLDNLYQYLLGQGLTAEEIQEQVDILQKYYEGKYSVTLVNPSETAGSTAQELQTVVEEDKELNAFLKNSIRRLGGVITNERPVSTFVGDDYRVKAGFKKGISIFDRRLLYNPPIGFPERRRPKKVAVISKEVVK